MKHIIQTYELTKDYTISRILKGGWQLAGGHGSIEREQAISDMFAYVENGITTFDCADIYTGVEELIGEFLEKYRGQFGNEAANKIKVHTKFVPDLEKLSTLNKKDIESIIDRSLQRLRLEQLHLVQFHWWDYDIPNYVETALVLKELQQKGKILHLAGTNFDVPHLKEITDAGVQMVSLQVQYSILDHRPEHKMLSFAQAHDIKFICYGAVAGGFLSEKYLGQAELLPPYENRSLTKYKLIIDEAGGWEYFQELLRILAVIAKKHKVSITNVATRYVLDKPEVAAVVIGARNASRLSDNTRVFSFEFDEADKLSLKTILAQAKGPAGDTYSLERIKGGKHASIMKYNLNKK